MLSEEKSRLIEMAVTGRACMMLVCINGYEQDAPYGIIVNHHLPCPVNFRGIHGLILALEEVCEMVGAPMATTQPRFLQKESEKQYRALKGRKRKKPDKVLVKEEVTGKMFPYVTAAKAVLLVHVLFRQNSSLQGRLRCSYTGTHYIAFRSALELMRMLDEVSTCICQNQKNKALGM